MKIENLKIDDVRPYDRNAKEHSKKQIQKIADSIAEFGFNQPIVIDKESVIIVGHGRYFAAQLLNRPEVPCLRIEIPEDKARAYRLADNKLNESDWNMDLAIEELKLLSMKLADLTGFDLNLLLETKEDKNDVAVPDTPNAKVGDLYELGTHRLICGDAANPEHYRALLGDERPRLIYTDPPYSIDYMSGGGFSYNSERFGGTGGRIFNDDKSPAEALAFYKAILRQLYDFTADDATIFWWFASRLTDINMEAMRENAWHYSQTCLWQKNSLIYSPSQLFHRIYESVMVGWKQGHEHYQNLTFSKFTEIWQQDQKNQEIYLDMWYRKRDPTNKYIHPTQKPVQLAEPAIKRCTEKGDIVIDAFGGSGSTLIACEQLHRKCRMMELDPKYVDAIIKRWESLTGDRAKKL